ncbi:MULTISPECIES: S41 family peptidase [unclassified Polaribacter]|uniref:S41 family peptidase n=1 Tax=unclassified Polaribacter TaxID=196858 RepID=UPI0011BE8E85|nr:MULTISPECIES: S41 family peptidase [unclassified Polaribacter]TXD51772.1 hypothetical protein ES043_10685 [Polaribacter sp. IC063]TXD58983.1 hypothetical protein ES044_11255 [Polaribacter sp. IC066]
MKIFFKVIYLSLFIAAFVSCSKEYEIPQDLVVQDFVWKGLNAYYLHQDKIEDLSDRRFSSDQQLNTFLNTFPNYNSLFSNLLIPSDVKSLLVEDFNTIAPPALRTDFTNGLEFGVFQEQDSDTLIGYALDILPLSYAANEPISRGDYFYAIVNTANDTIRLQRDNYIDLLVNYTQDTLKLVMVDYDGIDITLTGKKVALVKKQYNYEAVNFTKTMVKNADKIGYIMYNNDFSTNYINDLNNTFLELKNEAVNELILDVRYNIGGGSFAENIAQIASMITGQFEDEVFIKEEWNAKAQPWFIAYQPDAILTKFPEKLNENTTINSLNLTDIYLVLNGNNFTGSSAVELLINSLKPYINVHVIGNQTAGNNTGAITLYNSEDYNFPLKKETHSVALKPVVLSFLNKDDQTYENGFSPNLSLCANEDALNLGVLGEDSDPILNSVLAYIATGTAISNTNCNPNNFEYLYHSINLQRSRDTGVFIEQDLPNTN